MPKCHIVRNLMPRHTVIIAHTCESCDYHHYHVTTAIGSSTLPAYHANINYIGSTSDPDQSSAKDINLSGLNNSSALINISSALMI